MSADTVKHIAGPWVVLDDQVVTEWKDGSEDDPADEFHHVIVDTVDHSGWVDTGVLDATMSLIAAAPELRAFLDNDQWSIIDRAIERYSAGEISDLHALGLISAGFLKLDADRQVAIAKAEGR